MSVTLKAVANPTTIVQLKAYSEGITAESPVEIYINLDDYFIGSRLSVGEVPQNGVTYNIKHIAPVKVPAPSYKDKVITNPTIYSSYSLDETNYLRLTIDDKTLVVDKCTLDSSM